LKKNKKCWKKEDRKEKRMPSKDFKHETAKHNKDQNYYKKKNVKKQKANNGRMERKNHHGVPEV
jgi:hypothetical protein